MRITPSRATTHVPSITAHVESLYWAGNLNLASRDLPCIPSVLFEVHLGLNCQPLALVPNEPAHPPSDRPGRRRGGDTNVSWYEAQDLEVLKAGNNEILEIQPEISLFGSLKNVDVRVLLISSIVTSSYWISYITTN